MIEAKTSLSKSFQISGSFVKLGEMFPRELKKALAKERNTQVEALHALQTLNDITKYEARKGKLPTCRSKKRPASWRGIGAVLHIQ